MENNRKSLSTLALVLGLAAVAGAQQPTTGAPTIVVNGSPFNMSMVYIALAVVLVLVVLAVWLRSRKQGGQIIASSKK